MDLLFSPERRSKYILVSIVILIIIVLIGIFRLITDSIIIAILLLLGILYALLRVVGVYVMYPGSLNWSKADL